MVMEYSTTIVIIMLLNREEWTFFHSKQMESITDQVLLVAEVVYIHFSSSSCLRCAFVDLKRFD